MFEGATIENVYEAAPVLGTYVEDVVDERLAADFYALWTGPVEDFGGGVKSVTCATVVEETGGDLRRLQKLAKGLSRGKCKKILEACKNALITDDSRW